MSLIGILKRNINLRKKHLNLSWRTMAERIDEYPSTVRGWVNYGNPTLNTLEKIADSLATSVSALLDPKYDPASYEK
jgi:hypothetical protein